KVERSAKKFKRDFPVHGSAGRPCGRQGDEPHRHVADGRSGRVGSSAEAESAARHARQIDQSITRAPAGIATSGPTSRILVPSTRITGFASIRPPSGSRKRPARIAVTPAVVVGPGA